MTFRERRDRALTLMEEAGIRSVAREPPLHRLLWRFGVEVRPPHFGGLWPVRVQMALLGIVFAHAWSQMLGLPWLIAAIGLVLLFGGTAGTQYVRQAEALGLPSWEELDHADVGLRSRSILGLEPPPRSR